jgi:hypothetical protein
VSAVDEGELGEVAAKPSDTVAGYLAALAIFIALIGLVWHPLRLIGPAIIISMVAAAMGGRHQRLTFAAVVIVAACFFFGLMIAVVTSHSLW